jgi:hypothetical protein
MAGGQKIFPDGKNKHKYIPDSHVKILGRSDYQTLPKAKFKKKSSCPKLVLFLKN